VTREPVAVRVVAAESAGPLAEELAAAYEMAHPWVTVEVVVVNSSEAEVVLHEGAADLAFLSWRQADPGGPVLWSTPFRRDAIAVVLHPSTRLPGSSLGLLQEVFRGRVQEWEETVLIVVSREEGSGTRAAFESGVMGYHPVTLNAVVMPSSRAVVDTVSGTPGAIGYVSTLRLLPEDLEKVVVLRVEGVLPAPESIADGSYSLARQLYLAGLSEPEGAVRDLAQWLLGPEGQAVTARFESATSGRR
jgi:phosphate transport system substrate-binding protein